MGIHAILMMSRLPSPADTIEQHGEEDVPGLFHQGYGLEVQGYPHRKQSDTQAAVFLDRSSKFRIRLSNANEFTSMASVFVDDIGIGTFMLHPFSKFDLARPTDRPLQFTFMQESNTEGDDRRMPKKAALLRQLSLERTCVAAVFKPEVNGQVVQIVVTAHHLNRSQRLEMKNSTNVSELYEEIARDFGTWVNDPTSILIHWTTVEYDSPVEDLLMPTANTKLCSLKRLQEPCRKMSLVKVEQLHLASPDCHLKSTVLNLQSLPTFGEILAEIDKDQSATIYLLSHSSRLICTSDWVKQESYLLDLFHKDEILHEPLTITVTCSKPSSAFTLIVRQLGGETFKLLVDSETTICECRYQLGCIGGVVESCPLKRLQMRDPIAVDGFKPVDTAELIRREESKTKKKEKLNKAEGKDDRSKRRQRGTTLKGRSQQRFIEVDPIEVDERFFLEMSIAVFPKEYEECFTPEIESELQEAMLKHAHGGRTCGIL
ncbi:hypothetical protein CAPTEDRAFT_189596 [Capitella teleta]|uniref:Uncharacterized protein n=1 Tax=Capitella teleta TaxID=283909 RepID=R7VLD1_CAPTE|nr:hypothetical protein CAPTEDRAFT_189596 [Capitella teleta]|eukprot:ELU17525.1 hypothetical protein CAPTEDRAFT_189596 [Capitella teleta]